MSTTIQNRAASKSSVLRELGNKLFPGGKSGRKQSTPVSRGGRNLLLEGLERREMFSVSSLWFSGSTLVVKTDNASTSVAVSQVGSNIRISEVGTSRVWDYQAGRVGTVEFQGGIGHDRFVNYVANLPVRAFGGAGNDYLEGYNGNDVLYGGDGHDTLVGYGGNDEIAGGNGNDIIRGMAGNDRMWGEAGDDHIDGGAGDDIAWGGDDADILLGGDGNDQLIGGYGNDRLNGQAGIDKLWGESGNDVLISIDAAFGEYVDSGSGADIMWIDRVGSSRDNVYGATSSDIVQGVASFANGADRTLNGDNLADPTDAGQKARFNNVVSTGNTQGSNPLFGSSGPRMEDIRQGNIGDCYFLAGMGAIARDNSHAIRQNVVDFDDGTYGVRLGNSYYRVDNELSIWNAQNGASANNLRYAKLGSQNSMWVAVVEKAFAHYRKGTNSYASINGGYLHEANAAFRSTSIGSKSMRSFSTATAMANDIASKLAGGQALTIGFTGSAPVGGARIVTGHAYTVASVTRNSLGQVISITLRNPWGTDGGGNNDGANDGFVTLTPQQIYAQAGYLGWGRV
jgi:hypothetical protein